MPDTTEDLPEPENWQARLAAVIAKLDETIETGDPGPALRALEIANQVLAESVILNAKRGAP
jgi:hypothetical protein